MSDNHNNSKSNCYGQFSQVTWNFVKVFGVVAKQTDCWK